MTNQSATRKEQMAFITATIKNRHARGDFNAAMDRQDQNDWLFHASAADQRNAPACLPDYRRIRARVA